MKDRLIKWIKKWFDENGPESPAIIGISGGKDSTIAAALCVEALGKDRVIGVLMPNGIQKDIDDSFEVVKYLDIDYFAINIGNTVKELTNAISFFVEPTEQTEINIPPRIRMTTLYAIAQSINGRVVNTTNLCEATVGYFTKWGDSCGDISLFRYLTVSEVIKIGRELGLPDYFIKKSPADGLTERTDEENLGVTYQNIEDYIDGLLDLCSDIYKKIEAIEKNNKHKRNSYLQYFDPNFD